VIPVAKTWMPGSSSGKGGYSCICLQLHCGSRRSILHWRN
jgi:hypothetical protein